MLMSLRRLFTFRHRWETAYDGRGYIQGAGFSLGVRYFTIGVAPHNWFRVATGFRFLIDREWTRALKRRIQADDEQQAREV